MKICLYAICKNESKYVDQWYESAKEADYIRVLDTGSTDDTIKKLRAHGVTVEQKTYDLFRWDVARNDSMKLIPPDTDVCIVLDFDEQFNKGWAQVIRDNWVVGKHFQGIYTYVALHDENGDPKVIHTNTWMHNNDPHWYWKYAIHEELKRDDALSLNLTDGTLDLQNKVIIDHWQNLNRSRSFYNRLFEIRIEENDDLISNMYYGTYLYGLEEYEKAIPYCMKAAIGEPDMTITRDERADSCWRAGVCQFRLKNIPEAERVFILGTKIQPSYKPNYLELAKLYILTGYLDKAENILKWSKENTNNGWRWVDSVPENNLLTEIEKIKSRAL